VVDQQKLITTQVLEDVVKNSSADRISINDIVDAMEGVGFGLTMMIFAFGVIIPMPPPIPGIISIPLVIFSLQMMAGYTSPKLPKRFSKISIKRKLLATLVQKSAPYIRIVERVLRQRLIFMTTMKAERVIGFFTFLFSGFVLLPMPLSNFLPGLGVLIISFGLLGKDGLLVLLGIIVGLVGMMVSLLVVFLGFEFLYYLKDFLLGYF
jgi:hypothetical protein